VPAAAVLRGVVLLLLQAGAGCNSPIFAEIVPDELRSTIYAFDRWVCVSVLTGAKVLVRESRSSVLASRIHACILLVC
jgi:hypothetical protein